ncbi:26S proteasome regulatory subunit 6B [Rhizophlyctis rosea]|uniref:26S proteasome regulatory subunit 6B n=1 Tax=Rhizophlyctis rosea TaxID=64517 RepID=A0AAD5SLC7_9FUNG|nr:26S proteasome regulatory subunit 6B [Rhizophlyctis rosea]
MEVPTDYTKVHAYKLDTSLDEPLVREIFETCGDVEAVTVVQKLARNGVWVPKGDAIITYSHHESAKKAVGTLNNTQQGSRVMRVTPWVDRDLLVGAPPARPSKLNQHLKFLSLYGIYIKDEQKNLKCELIRAQEEVKRNQSVPLVIGQFMEPIDQHTGIVEPTTRTHPIPSNSFDRSMYKRDPEFFGAHGKERYRSKFAQQAREEHRSGMKPFASGGKKNGAEDAETLVDRMILSLVEPNYKWSTPEPVWESSPQQKASFTAPPTDYAILPPITCPVSIPQDYYNAPPGYYGNLSRVSLIPDGFFACPVFRDLVMLSENQILLPTWLWLLDSKRRDKIIRKFERYVGDFYSQRGFVRRPAIHMPPSDLKHYQQKLEYAKVKGVARSNMTTDGDCEDWDRDLHLDEANRELDKQVEVERKEERLRTFYGQYAIEYMPLPPGYGGSADHDDGDPHGQYSYIDEAGNEWGPFNARLMNAWHAAGAFDVDDEILIARKDANEFEPLGYWIEEFGTETPFPEEIVREVGMEVDADGDVKMGVPMERRGLAFDPSFLSQYSIPRADSTDPLQYRFLAAATAEGYPTGQYQQQDVRANVPWGYAGTGGHQQQQQQQQGYGDPDAAYDQAAYQQAREGYSKQHGDATYAGYGTEDQCATRAAADGQAMGQIASLDSTGQTTTRPNDTVLTTAQPFIPMDIDRAPGTGGEDVGGFGEGGSSQ